MTMNEADATSGLLGAGALYEFWGEHAGYAEGYARLLITCLRL